MAAGSGNGVCLTALDGLVKGFMAAERMPEASELPPASVEAWRACEGVCDTVEHVSVLQGLQAADSVDATVLQDQRLLFQLKKQELVEALRAGDTAEALARAREELSQLALDAYPEAYGEFQTAMSAFLWSRGASGAPEAVRDLWAPSERTRLAETLAHTLKLSVGGYDSDLSYVVRYLLLAARAFHNMDARSRGSHRCGAACELAGVLLKPERAARALAPEGAANFPEGVVQALGQATEMSREEAIAALKRSGGDAHAALRAELGCFRLDGPLMQELAREYAFARDLVAGSVVSAPEDTAANGRASRSTEADGDRKRSPSSSPPRKRRGVSGNSSSDSGSRALDGDPDSTAAQGPGGGDHGGLADMEEDSVHSAPAAGDRGRPPAGSTTISATVKYAAALKVKQHAKANRFDLVEAELQRLDPNFIDNHPKVLFEVRRCQFAGLVASGKTAEAITFARTQLTPLAAGDEQMASQAKAALAQLMLGAPKDQGPQYPTALQVSVCKALGLEEPRLVELLSVLLQLHAAYCAKARQTDRFEGAIGVAALRAAGAPASGSASAAAAAAAPVAGAAPAAGPPEAWGADGGDASDYSHDDDDDGGGDDDDDGGEEVTEANILLTMEFTGLPRAQCVELLLLHGNDPQVVMHSLFS
mmetsp:Transcript_4938/g.14219  ORF Transcript_4938/g.14219 Transcript_4938/m.14219 type:complete len:650 (-) Transcript_4938:561-2510(-)|eukprot:CAMPEP_0206145396 /NCGR_PEP_ID=MMETSP1473-20131121/27194_1 /ASSEMBLY_ACC=CAM_ASM_001109 /TAXON_ID=1461547 /ORGANISM="Stichococcus sp, Strain RCC1054" /LENGTH=649 /DNA_ID=CAMNT_0053541583 /DNA_START=103 /DNA_END=2052 /DNA_ORIENTATION=-